jgi:hypothetical protein
MQTELFQSRGRRSPSRLLAVCNRRKTRAVHHDLRLIVVALKGIIKADSVRKLSWHIGGVAGVRGPPSTLDLFVIDKTQARFANSSSSDLQILAFLLQGFAMKYGVLVQQETGMTWWCARKSLAPVSGPVIDHPLHQATLVRSHSLEAPTAGIDPPPLRPLFETRRIRQAWFHSVPRTDGFFRTDLLAAK